MPPCHMFKTSYPHNANMQKISSSESDDGLIVPLLAVESALGTSGAALVARITRDTHVCG